MSAERVLLEGWKGIADVLTRAAGVPVSAEQARRYAREHDLPVRRTGPCGRRRILAERDAVVEWCVRTFG
jgi:hypothetical protein